MSRQHINAYRTSLAKLHAVTGSLNERVLSKAFGDLLERWGRSHDLMFTPQWEGKGPRGNDIAVDGALVPAILRIPFGYWEAKDSKDDLDREIAKKRASGYPDDNIIYEDTVTAVLRQDGREVDRTPLADDVGLTRLLTRFFAFERPEIAEFRKAAAQFRADLPVTLEVLRAAITEAETANPGFAAAARDFLAHAKNAINPAVTAADVREMLIQHILTEAIFTRVFDDAAYHRENNVAQRLTELEGKFLTGALRHATTQRLAPYYNAITAAAAQIADRREKQTFLKRLYEDFYKVYNPKAADRLGVVYTPGEIVRFMIRGADWLCEQHFGKCLIDPGVEILDPATGTGTFIVELLEHFAGDRDKLRHKYKEELHANEVAILPYYVANLNIEATYAAITGQYAEFPNLCFVDTLDNVDAVQAVRASTHVGDMFGGFSDENMRRIRHQNNSPISVIIGNPPYNANQIDDRNNNKNRTYRFIDGNIKATYVRESNATKTATYDMYARFFRWASDRLPDEGIVAFITNRSFYDSFTFDGFRTNVAKEFAEAWIVDLGGDVRQNAKLSGTTHNVFGIQTGVAISFLVKRPGVTPFSVRYARRPEEDTAADKLAFLESVQDFGGLEFRNCTPRPPHNWHEAGLAGFGDLLPLAIAGGARKQTQTQIFDAATTGMMTGRDDWIYGLSPSNQKQKSTYLLSEIGKIKLIPEIESPDIKWSRNLRRAASTLKYIPSAAAVPIKRVLFRPFFKEVALGHRLLIDETGGQLEQMTGDNIAICFLCLASHNLLATFATKLPYDYGLLKQGNGGTQGLLRYRYTKSGERVDNITDWAVAQFRARYAPSPPSSGGEGDTRPLARRGEGERPSEDAGLPPLPGPREDARLSPSPPEGGGEGISKDAIFAYVYAALHDPVWRTTYAADLRRSFPRIPLHDDFARWRDWGQALLALHIGYESAAPFALTRTDAADPKGKPPVPKLKSEPETGTIILDSATRLTGVPRAAWDYRLGNRSAIDWVLDQHKEKTIRDPVVAAKFNTYRFADHKERVIALLARVVTVSVETVAIVEAMRGAGGEPVPPP